jgi:hypothetical protein
MTSPLFLSISAHNKHREDRRSINGHKGNISDIKELISGCDDIEIELNEGSKIEKEDVFATIRIYHQQPSKGSLAFHSKMWPKGLLPLVVENLIPLSL